MRKGLLSSSFPGSRYPDSHIDGQRVASGVNEKRALVEEGQREQTKASPQLPAATDGKGTHPNNQNVPCSPPDLEHKPFTPSKETPRRPRPSRDTTAGN